MEIDRKKWGTVLAILYALGFVIALLLHTAYGVNLGHFLLKRNENLFAWGNAQLALAETENHTLIGTFTSPYQTLTAELEVLSERQLRFTDGDGTKHLCAINPDGSLSDAQGKPLWMQELASDANEVIIIVGNDDPDYFEVSQYSLYEALWQIESGNLERWGSVWVVVLYTVGFALGALSVLFPEEMHLFGRRHFYDHIELSVDGISMMRLSGIVVIVLSYVLAVSPLFIGG